MQTDLVATFANSLGKKHDWTYRGLNPDLPIAEIKDACELLTTLDIFETNGVKQFDSVVTAKIITTTEEDIFDLEKELPIADKQSVTEKETAKPKKALLALSTQTKNKYDYLYSDSRKAIESSLEGPATTLSVQPLLKTNALPIENQPSTTIKRNSASTSSDPIPPPSDNYETVSPKKGLLAWLRRRRNRNKDDPDLHSRDPE